MIIFFPFFFQNFLGFNLAERKDKKLQTNNMLKATKINARNQYLDNLNTYI